MNRSLLIAFGALLLAFSGLIVWKRLAPGTEVSEADRRTDTDKRAKLLQFWESYNQATRLRTGGNFLEAADHYRACLVTDPEHEESIYYLGNCLLESGNYSEALRWFERLIRLNPRSQRGHSQIGVISSLPAPGAPLDYQRAIQALERNLELDPEESGSFLRLGHIALEQGQLPRAYELFSKAAGFSSPEGMFWAGYVQFQQGRYREAADQFRRVMALADRERQISSRGGRGEGDLSKMSDAARLTPLRKAELKSQVYLYWCGPEFRNGLKEFAANQQVHDSVELNIREVLDDEISHNLEGRLLYSINSTEDFHRLTAVSPRGVAFYRQEQGQTSLDLEEEPGDQDLEGGWSACLGDVDQDGRDDLYVVQAGFVGTGDNRLYLNRVDGEGKPYWEEVTDEYGLSGKRATATARLTDVNGDGLVDLIEAGNSSPGYPALRLFLRAEKGFREAGSSFPPVKGSATDLVVADFDGDGWQDVAVTRWKRPPLFLCNNGDGTFMKKQPDAFAEVRGTALACSVVDYDQDQRPDLLIGERSNYETALNYLFHQDIPALEEGTVLLFRNEGDWNFRDVTSVVGLGLYPGAIDLIPADFNNDSWPDLLVVNGGLASYWRIPSHILVNQEGQRYTLATTLPGFLPVRPTGAAVIPLPGARSRIVLAGVGLFDIEP